MGDPTRKAIVDVLAPAPSRCRHVRRATGLEGAYFAYGEPLAALGINYLSLAPFFEPPLEGAPQRHEPAQAGRVCPKHPADLRSGTQMGSDSPGQHEYTHLLEVSCLVPENHTRHTRRGKLYTRSVNNYTCAVLIINML